MSDSSFSIRNKKDLCNADRARWAGSALAKFAEVSGAGEDLDRDAESVLCDLLVDLMHWCDFQGANDLLGEPIDFGSALELALGHYRSEASSACSGTVEDPDAQ